MTDSNFKLLRYLDFSFALNHTEMFFSELVFEFTINCSDFPQMRQCMKGTNTEKLLHYSHSSATNAVENKANTNHLVYNHIIIGRRGIKNLPLALSL